MKYVLLIVAALSCSSSTADAQTDSITGLHSRIQDALSRSALSKPTLKPEPMVFANAPIIYWPEFTKMEIIQVVDATSALISVDSERENVIPVLVWYEGDTAGLTDGKEFKCTEMIPVIEDGTKQYATVSGGTNTVRRVRNVTLEHMHELFPTAIKLTSKKGESALAEIHESKSGRISVKYCYTGKSGNIKVSLLDTESKDLVKDWEKKRADDKKAARDSEGK